MSLFTRTSSGVANYPKFFHSDLVAYVEGKNLDGTLDTRPDEVYYGAVISAFTGLNKIKIKVVGNRAEVLKYAADIHAGNIQNSIAFVDRDYDGILFSTFPRGGYCMTYGYSWENDFWNELLSVTTLESASINCNALVLQEIGKQIQTSKQSLFELFLLDCAYKLFDEALLKKNGGACGVNFSYKCEEVIGKGELERLFKKAENHPISECPMSKELIKDAKLKRADLLIQGHLWEHVILSLISTRYKMLEGTTIPHKAIRNIALNLFKVDPKKFLDVDCAAHYENELSRFLS